MSLPLVAILACLSTALVIFSIRSLPVSFTESGFTTVHDIVTLSRDLLAYSQKDASAKLHVLFVLSISAIWKHAWSIPGSVIWNVVGGALFSPLPAAILLTLLTTIGSVCATLLSMPLAPFLIRCFPNAFQLTRAALEGDSNMLPVSAPSTPTSAKFPSSSPPPQLVASSVKSPTWIRLALLRLIGIVPWSLLNIASGVCRIPLIDCFLGAFVGSLPWTTVTCQMGALLQTLSTQSQQSQSLSSLIFTPQIISRLVLLTVVSIAPILGRSWLKGLLGLPDDAQSPPISTKKEKYSSVIIQRPAYPKFQPQPKSLSKSLTQRSRTSRARDRASWGTWIRRSLSLPRCETSQELRTIEPLDLKSDA